MQKQNARSVYMVIRTMEAFFYAVTFTTSAIYRFETAGLDPLQLVLVGTALESSVLLFEVPTGVVADLYSRRLSVIIGYALIGLGFIVEGLLPTFGTILIAQVVWGTGYTFTSGALDAWLAGELGEAKLPQVYLRGSQLAQAAGMIGIFVGVATASLRLSWPFLIGGVGMLLLSVILRLIMPEAGFEPQKSALASVKPWTAFSETLGQGTAAIRRSPLLVTVIGISLFTGLYSEALDRLWQPHFLDNFGLPKLGAFDEIFWFGIISSATLVVSIIATEIARRRIGQIDHSVAVRILWSLDGVLITGLVVFGLTVRFEIALAAYGAITVARRTSWPIFNAWINRGIDNKVRATVLSTIGQVDAIGQIAGGPLVGSLARRWGLRLAMVASGMILTPALALYFRASRINPQEHGDELNES